MAKRIYRKPEPAGRGSLSVSAKFPKALLATVDRDARRLKVTRSYYIFQAATEKVARAPKS